MSFFLELALGCFFSMIVPPAWNSWILLYSIPAYDSIDLMHLHLLMTDPYMPLLFGFATMITIKLFAIGSLLVVVFSALCSFAYKRLLPSLSALRQWRLYVGLRSVRSLLASDYTPAELHQMVILGGRLPRLPASECIRALEQSQGLAGEMSSKERAAGQMQSSVE